MAFWAAAIFLLILASLHFAKPEVDPSWNFISEYQVGAFGPLMSVAFFTLAMSCLFLIVALWRYLRSAGGIFGMLLLAVTAGGLITAAFNPTDPINTPPELVTSQGELHQIGATLDQIPLAAILLCFFLIRKHPYWKSNSKPLIGVTILVCTGMIVFIGSLSMYMPADGIFGPHTPFGWPNRFMICTQAVWVMVVARIAHNDRGREKLEVSTT